MSNRFTSAKFSLFLSVLSVGCTSTQQIAIDYPSVDASNNHSTQSTSQQFQALPGFSSIDGDDYYIRLVSEFDFKGNNILKSGCASIAPSYKEGDLSAALIFNVRNDILKFSHEAAGFSYQAATGKCNFKFDAKKLNLTPWMRLDSARETSVDYSFYSSANSDVDVSGLVGDVTKAGSLLALTGVGMGVAIIGQFANQWMTHNQQTETPVATPSAKHSSESHSLPAIVTFSGKTGNLHQTVFQVYAVAEGGINLFSSNTRPLGELKIYPEIIPSLLLKTTINNVPDARDLSLEEIGNLPIKSANGEIKLLQLIEQSKHSAKPNLKPNWMNYEEVESNCRKLKLVMKDLGFNKFDRNALLYYFLVNNNDWKNYNITSQKASGEEISVRTMQNYRSKDFGNCLAVDDYAVMKAMGLSVNTPSDWNQMGESSQKKEQLFTPLKSIERQLVAVLKNPGKTEMERQIYPLLTTAEKGDGTVLLQNHLGDFGLEKLLSPSPAVAAVPTVPASSGSTAATVPAAIPGEGVIITANQLVQVFSGLSINELSCARIIPDTPNRQTGNVGILLFTTNEGSPRSKGGAMEFEFLNGKIIRIAFQLPTYRDFEQHLLDHPEMGGCRIDPAFLAKLH